MLYERLHEKAKGNYKAAKGYEVPLDHLYCEETKGSEYLNLLFLYIRDKL